MINKVTFYKLLGSIAGLVLWALVAAQLAYAHPVRRQVAPHQHSAKATTVAFEGLAATLNTEWPNREDKHRLLTSPKLSKALAELVEHSNVSPSQDECVEEGGCDDGGVGGRTCPDCSCVKGNQHWVLCNSTGGSWCIPLNDHWCTWP
jgi:hypothetical protein